MLQFLGTKIGISLILALIIIGGATAVKFRSPDQNSDINSKVGLIADASIDSALKNGELDTSGWEDTLKNLGLGTTTNDIIANLEEKTANIKQNDKPLTATDRFAQEFFTKYVKLQESGTPIDETTGTKLVNELLKRDYGGPTEEKTYTTANITVVNTTSLGDLKKYGNSLGSAFDQPIPKGYENEIVIINRVYETENYDDLEKLALNIARYNKMRSEIAAITVPNILKNAHISLLNSFSAIIEGVRGMALVSTDPVGATKMILRYEDGLKALELSAKEISAYFKRQNVIFSSTEAGFVFAE